MCCVQAAQSDSEEDWEDAGVSTTPLHTPANSLKKLMKVPLQNTPTLCDVLDTPDFRAQTSRCVGGVGREAGVGEG